MGAIEPETLNAPSNATKMGAIEQKTLILLAMLRTLKIGVELAAYFHVRVDVGFRSDPGLFFPLGEFFENLCTIAATGVDLANVSTHKFPAAAKNSCKLQWLESTLPYWGPTP